MKCGPFVALALALAASVSAQETGPTLSAETRSILGVGDAGLETDVLAVLGQPEGPKLAEADVDERAALIALKLRCPVCQGVSISDSPSGMAAKMRGQVRDLVAGGYSEEQVVRYFERSYGEFVRLQPPLRGLNILLWILPGLVLLGGAAFVFRMARSPSASPPGSSAPIEIPRTSEVDPDLAKYLERIRRDAGIPS